jgi:predicted permease
MENFSFIFIQIIIPIFMQIAAGYILQKKFDLNKSTLTKLQFYILIPAIMFTTILETEITMGLLFHIIWINIALCFLLYGLGWLYSIWRKDSKSISNAMINSVCLYNSGNYCIPLIQLLFNNPFAFMVLIFNMITQNLISFTVGVFNASAGQQNMRGSLIEMLKNPMIITVVIASVWKSTDIGVWEPAWNALGILGKGMVPIALITLGAQLATTNLNIKIPRIYVSAFLRLIASPAIAFVLVALAGIEGIAAQVIIICSAAPSSVNALLLAMEYDNEPEFLSQTVFFSTLLSAITVSVVIQLVMNL